MSLSKEQQHAFELFKAGKNLFVTGPGGTGKTRLIHSFVNYINSGGNVGAGVGAGAARRGGVGGKKTIIQVCSTTGCSAILLNCNARTIHSWSGIRLAKGTRDQVVDQTLSRKQYLSQWRTTDILVLDECSMMSQKIFEILEELGRRIRRNSLPFGGLQVIFCGDFFQLPPVDSGGDDLDGKFCFESPRWLTVFGWDQHIELKTIFRQKDEIYINILLEIRRGKISEDNIEVLQQYIIDCADDDDDYGDKFVESISNLKLDDDDSVIASSKVKTKLYATRSKVERINNSMFSKLLSPLNEFELQVFTNCGYILDTVKPITDAVEKRCNKMSDGDKEREINYLRNNIPSAEIVQLKVGAVVMCNYNLDMDSGICNGAQGIIIEFKAGLDDVTRVTYDYPIVKFNNGCVRMIKHHYWQSEEYPCIAVAQLPLCLAWALTIHKIQGATLDCAEIDIGSSIFEYGQIYVALSRIRSLDGLSLLAFQPQKIRANPKVIEFYEEIERVHSRNYMQNILLNDVDVDALNENVKVVSVKDSQSRANISKYFGSK